MSGRAVHILLVEDSPADVYLVDAAFEAAGFQDWNLHLAWDGEEAVQFVEQAGSSAGFPRPDLILLDLNLPRKNGFEVLQQLKGHAEYRSIPVAILSTSDAEEDIERAMRLQANAYHVKPSSLSDLVEMVRSMEQYWFTINQAYDGSNRSSN